MQAVTVHTSILGPLSDPSTLLQGLGPSALLVIAALVFIESGVLFPFLPGDSLLFTAGLLHKQLSLPLWLLIGVVVIAAIAGDQVGYWLGRRFGRRWFKDNARILKTKHLHQTENFFARRGAAAVVLSRFVPIIRTYAPLVAGTANYDYKKFTTWNIVGAITWSVSIILIGNFLGRFEFIANNIDVIAVLIILVSILPSGIAFLRSRRKGKELGAE